METTAYMLPSKYTGYGWVVRFAYDDVFYPGDREFVLPSSEQFFDRKNRCGLKLYRGALEHLATPNENYRYNLISHDSILVEVQVIPVIGSYTLYYPHPAEWATPIDTADRLDLSDEPQMMQVFHTPSGELDSMYYSLHEDYHIEVYSIY